MSHVEIESLIDRLLCQFCGQPRLVDQCTCVTRPIDVRRLVAEITAEHRAAVKRAGGGTRARRRAA